MTWELHETHDETHIVPQADVVDHTHTIDCVCKPRRDKICLWVVIHNSRDGREQYEPDQERRVS